MFYFKLIKFVFRVVTRILFLPYFLKFCFFSLSALFLKFRTLSVTNCLIFTVEWYRKHNGREIAVIQGYTYSVDGRSKTTDLYRCTVSRLCRGRFVITKDRESIKSSHLEHNHPPLPYVIRNGVYIRL